MSKKFEHGKVYRFVPTKMKGFGGRVKRSKYYSGKYMWELEITSVFTYRGKTTDNNIEINEFTISRSWCEEVK